MEQVLDQEGLRNEFVKKALLDWKGLTRYDLAKLNVSVELTDENEKDEIPFSDEVRDMMAEESVGFIMMVEEVSTTWVAFANKQKDEWGKKSRNSSTNKSTTNQKKTT